MICFRDYKIVNSIYFDSELTTYQIWWISDLGLRSSSSTKTKSKNHVPSSWREIYQIWLLDWYQKYPWWSTQVVLFRHWLKTGKRHSQTMFGLLLKLTSRAPGKAKTVHSISTKRGCQQKTRPLVHSVKPNQYTASVLKANVKEKAPTGTQTQAQPIHKISAKQKCYQQMKVPISTQRQAQPVHITSLKRDVKKKTKVSINTQRQAQPIHGTSAKTWS